MRIDLFGLGLLLFIVGIVLDLTLIGAIIGLPIGAIGAIMVIASLSAKGKHQTAEQQGAAERGRRYERYQAEGYNRHRREQESQERSRRKK